MNDATPDKSQEHHLRDDAEDQPESGYPDGRLSAKPSADLDEDKEASQKGSEAEFDSKKV
jgi:hypothetical protein